MPDTFQIFPREAVLIGLALSEYLRLHEFGEHDTFERVVYRRLRPFVADPDAPVEIEEPIDDPDFELPPRLCWYDFGDGSERSFPDLDFDDELNESSNRSLSPATSSDAGASTYEEFSRHNGKTFRVRRVAPRPNTITRIREYLASNGAGPPVDPDQVVLRRWKIVGEPTEQAAIRKKIDMLINRLAADSGYAREFEFGKRLGRAFADCIMAEKQLIVMEEEYYEVAASERSIRPADLDGIPWLRDSWKSAVSELSRDPLFLESFIAPEFVQSGKGFWAGSYFGLSRGDPDTLDGVIDGMVNEMMCVRTTLSLILGYVLGWLLYRDLKAAKEDAVRPIPRGLRLSPNASEETVAGQLLMVEQAAFNEVQSRRYLPETIIRQIGNTIEALSRQIWPLDFEDIKKEGKTGNVPKILSQKKRTGDALEKRFALAAEPLWAVYRNASEHDSTFKCSWHEGHYFHVACRHLLDLKRRIIAERNAASPGGE